MMNYDDIIIDSKFHEWEKYEPLEIQYWKYADSNPSLIAVGYKIQDVYQAFCKARASLMYADSDDFGDIAGESDNEKLYAKCHFLVDAILWYAICLDLSWQVVWAYIQPTSLEYLMRQNYKEMEKECTRDNILAQLKCVISQHGFEFSKAQKILDIVITFDNNEDTLKLRSIYNKIKHQGIIHFDGLGANFSEQSVRVDGKVLPMLHRDSYKPEEIENLLFAYHEKFQTYMNDLILIMVPDEYLESTMKLGDALDSMVRMGSIID